MQSEVFMIMTAHMFCIHHLFTRACVFIDFPVPGVSNVSVAATGRSVMYVFMQGEKKSIKFNIRQRKKWYWLWCRDVWCCNAVCQQALMKGAFFAPQNKIKEGGYNGYRENAVASVHAKRRALSADIFMHTLWL